MVLHKNIIFGVLVVSFALSQASTENEIYPFVDNAKLSWNDFEKDFRQRYNHLDIPPFVLTQNDDFTTAYLMPDATGKNIQYKSVINKLYEYTNNHYQAPLIIVNPSCAGCNSLALEWTLLHEMGHFFHNSGGRNEDEENYAQAKLKAESVTNAMYKILIALNLGLMSRNIYNYVHQQNSKKLVMAQLIALLAYHKRDVIEDVTDSFIASQYIKIGEYMADDFANTHARQEALQAGLYLFSKKGWLESIKNSMDGDAKEGFSLVVEENSKIDGYGKHMIVSAAKFILNSVYFFHEHGYLDLSHPSHKIRSQNIQKALKNRFNFIV